MHHLLLNPPPEENPRTASRGRKHNKSQENCSTSERRIGLAFESGKPGTANVDTVAQGEALAEQGSSLSVNSQYLPS